MLIKHETPNGLAIVEERADGSRGIVATLTSDGAGVYNSANDGQSASYSVFSLDMLETIYQQTKEYEADTVLNICGTPVQVAVITFLNKLAKE